MARQSPAPKITHSLPLTAGWKRGASGVCQSCGSTFISSTNRGQLYCSRSCSGRARWAGKTPAERAAISAKTAAKLLGRPSWNKGIPCSSATKQRLSASHKASGHRPILRGGNGQIAPCEQMMREMLPPYWDYQYVVLTGEPRGKGYPTSYKLDFALPFKRWGLEVDGNSHTSRKGLDAKKDTLLASLGWCVFRVTNQQVRAWYTTFKLTGLIPIQLPDA